jgi:hypothetical protein
MQATANAYHDGESWAPGSAINYHVIGFNDVLLMAAECEAQVGSLDQAETYVNMIRNRAANPAGFVFTYVDNSNPLAGFTTTPAANYHVGPYPPGVFTSQAYALKAIYFERKLELGMEGHRIFDLVRWGIFSQEQQSIFAYEAQYNTEPASVNLTPFQNGCYPIPQAEIDISAVGGKAALTQNPGY